MTYATAWTCNTIGIEQDCIVTATTTDESLATSTEASSTPNYATSTPGYTGLNYHEALLLGCMILFFVSFRAWGSMFRLIGKI